MAGRKPKQLRIYENELGMEWDRSSSAASSAGSVKGTPGLGRESGGGDSRMSYANRAASAIEAVKAPGALARLGKVLYSGGSASSSAGNNSNAGQGVGGNSGSGLNPSSSVGGSATTTSPMASGANRSRRPEALMLPKSGGGRVRYAARGPILAMDGSKGEANVAAIVGKDFLRVLKIGEDGASVTHDLKTRAGFDKLYAVTSLRWGRPGTPYERTIALGNAGGAVRLLGVERAHQTQELGGSTRAVMSLAFGGAGILAASSDGVVRMWDPRDGGRRPPATFAKNGDSAREVVASPLDAHKFAVIYDSGVVQRWDARSPSQPDRRINAHSGPGLTLDWHPELDYLATGGRDHQIQVWNMGTAGGGDGPRKPEYVVLAPEPVGKVRWAVPAPASGSNGSTRLQSAALVSSGRSRNDSNVYVWTLGRPHVPRQVLEDHSEAVVDLCPRGERLLWSASKDKSFVQHDLLLEPFVLDNLRSAVTGWSPHGEAVFVDQDKTGAGSDVPSVPVPQLGPGRVRPSPDGGGPGGIARSASSYFFTNHTESGDEQSPGDSSFGRRGHKRPSTAAMAGLKLSDASFDGQSLVHALAVPGQDAASFGWLAVNYKVHALADETLVDCCAHNSQVAFTTRRYRTAQVWAILESAVADEQRRFAEVYHARLPDKVDLAKLVTLHPMAPPEPRKALDAPQTATATTPARTPPPDGFRPLLSERPPGSSDDERNDNQVDDEDDDDVDDDDVDDLDDNSNHAGHKTQAGGISISRPRAHTISNDSAVLSVSPGSGDYGTSLGVTSMSPEDMYGRAGTSFTRLPMVTRGTAGTSASTASGSGSTDEMGRSITDWRTSILEDIEEDSEPTPRAGKNALAARMPTLPAPSTTSRLSHALESLSATPQTASQATSPAPPSDRPMIVATAPSASSQNQSQSQSSNTSTRDLYTSFLAEQTYPWRTEQLLIKAFDYALEQGDVQLCAILVLLLRHDYPSMCPSHVAEEVVLSYLTLLKRHGLFSSAAEVAKVSDMEPVRALGQTETSLDTLCAQCRRPLSENVDAPDAWMYGHPTGFWYCVNCKSLLHTCSICREPVRTLTLVTLRCGHECHESCLREWFCDLAMSSCPAGCGLQIEVAL